MKFVMNHESRPTALIIGSGFGGIATGIRLQARGYKTIIFEKLDQPGGRASVFRQDGFTFDAGPTIVTAPFLLEELWDLCGRKFSDSVVLKEMSPFYRIRFDDGTFFDYSGNPERMREQIRKFSPNEVESYDNFMKKAELCYQLGYEDLGNLPYNTLTDLIKSIPSMIRMEAWQSIYKSVSKYFRNEKLRQVFSFHPLLIGGDPSAVTCVYSLIAALEKRHGVHSAIGGTGAIVSAMVDLYEDIGGEIIYNSEVAKIDVRQSCTEGLFLKNGKYFKSNVIVSNGDTAWTYTHLLDKTYRKKWSDKKIRNSSFSMSLFVWYFGTSKIYQDVKHHTILLGKSYLPLLRKIFREKTLSEDFSLYLHRPTATDKSMAPPSHDTFYVLSPVPNLLGKIDWEKEKESYREKIETYLENTVLPGLKKSIVTSKVFTPNDFEQRYLALNGAAFGMEPLLLQSAWFRPHNKSEDIKGLYMVGASTHPGAGIPGVLTSAKLLDKVIPESFARGKVAEKKTGEQAYGST